MWFVCISRMGTSIVEEEEEVDTRNSKRVVKNLKERNVDTKKKSPKQGLTSAEDLTIKLRNKGRDSTYHSQIKLTNLTYSIIYGP